ncbi:MAG: hypothetical protein LBT70_00900 [Holosporaceae bacterium]|jgi:hypothetical protein|nr:hypothetical protein [Holosporaceae bacterium]
MLSKQSLDILIDLVEIKLSAIMVIDGEDLKEVRKLKLCRNELLTSRKFYTKNLTMLQGTSDSYMPSYSHDQTSFTSNDFLEKHI